MTTEFEDAMREWRSYQDSRLNNMEEYSCTLRFPYQPERTYGTLCFSDLNIEFKAKNFALELNINLAHIDRISTKGSIIRIYKLGGSSLLLEFPNERIRMAVLRKYEVARQKMEKLRPHRLQMPGMM